MMKKSIFDVSWPTLHTKRVIHNACVLALLLYGSECWTPLRADVQALLSFHHHHVRSILSLSRKDTWESRMTTGQLLELLGGPVDISDKIDMQRLEWLGHVVRMEYERMPKCLLFASMDETRPACGPRKRWRDCILSNVPARDALDTWFVTASSSRVEWRSLLSTPVRPVQQPEKSNARCAFVCFLIVEILSATNVQQRDRSELKTSGAHAGAPIADVGFGARVNWLSTDVARPLVAILCSENQKLPSDCHQDSRPPLNVLSLALSVDVGRVFGDSRTCHTIALSASRRLLPPSGAPRGHIWQCIPRSKVQSV